MKLPFQLDEGIYFENSGKMLRWADSFQNLILIDSPEISANGDVLKWYDKTCFGGKKLNVIVVKDSYHNLSERLEFVEFESKEMDPWLLYKYFSEYFKSYFGVATESAIDKYARPTLLWNLNDLQIILGVGERFVEFEIFGIHKGDKFWTLTKQTKGA